VLIQLLRLSWGFQKDECLVGLPTLSKRAGISESQGRRATRKLVEMGCLQIVEQDFTNPNQKERGTRYRILLPAAPTQQRGATQQKAPAHGTPNKEIKEIKKDSKRESASPNFQDCPDCHGTGFHYVDELDRGKGVEKCSHSKLKGSS
jgi:hypothetical protein